nr:MAG TPA: hypothetical protein [Caudoviricetes sp.]DAS26081.1 MAG TPA: hypothetical protein [Caudoviricetes sp.]
MVIHHKDEPARPFKRGLCGLYSIMTDLSPI